MSGSVVWNMFYVLCMYVLYVYIYIFSFLYISSNYIYIYIYGNMLIDILCDGLEL